MYFVRTNLFLEIDRRGFELFDLARGDPARISEALTNGMPWDPATVAGSPHQSPCRVAAPPTHSGNSPERAQLRFRNAGAVRPARPARSQRQANQRPRCAPPDRCRPRTIRS